MLPLLRVAGDGQDHIVREAADALATHLKLTSEELAELLPSGRQTRFLNRVNWAILHLKKGKLLEPAGYGRFRITARGSQLLAEEPPGVDMKFLQRFPEYAEFYSGVYGKKEGPEKPDVVIGPDSSTPEEQLEATYQKIRNSLEQELLETVKAASPAFFEVLVVDLLVAMGYGGSRRDAGEAVGRTGDGGIDGIIKEDKLGLDAVYVQAKRWDATVGRPIVQAFAGSLEGNQARKGVLITTSTFSSDARAYVKTIGKRIVLIDGKELSRLMVDHSVGVTDVVTYAIRRIEPAYFQET
jgi:restriction system protein